MLPALRERATTIIPHLPLLSARADEPEADAAQPVAAERLRVLTQPERADAHVMRHPARIARVIVSRHA